MLIVSHEKQKTSGNHTLFYRVKRNVWCSGWTCWRLITCWLAFSVPASAFLADTCVNEEPEWIKTFDTLNKHHKSLEGMLMSLFVRLVFMIMLMCYPVDTWFWHSVHVAFTFPFCLMIHTVTIHTAARHKTDVLFKVPAPEDQPGVTSSSSGRFCVDTF